MEVTLLHVPASVAETVEVARACEKWGIDRLGIGDSPKAFGALYPNVQAALTATRVLKVGPLVTNPVTRSPLVHASTFEAFEELFPGRAFLGMGVGDSAVRAEAKSPATWKELGELARAVSARTDRKVEIITAVDGNVLAAHLPSESSAVLMGCGMDHTHYRTLGERIPNGVKRWLFLHSLFFNEAEPDRRHELRAPVLAFSRHVLAKRYATRGVPEKLHASLLAAYAAYDPASHSKLGSKNEAVLAEFPEVEDYLLSRFALVGTPEQAAERVTRFASEVGAFNIALGSAVRDKARHIRLIGERFIPTLRSLHEGS